MSCDHGNAVQEQAHEVVAHFSNTALKGTDSAF